MRRSGQKKRDRCSSTTYTGRLAMAVTTTVTVRTAPPQCHRPVPTRQSWLCRNGRSPVLPSSNVSQSLHARHALHALLAPVHSATRRHQRWLDAEPRRRLRRHGVPARAGLLGGIPIPVSLPGLRPLASAMPLQPSSLGPARAPVPAIRRGHLSPRQTRRRAVRPPATTR